MATDLGRVVSIFVLAWVAGAAGAADIPDPLKKLTGSSDETARSVMTQQGYALQHQKTSWGREYGFWWNVKTRQCVQIMTLAGRVTQVQAKGESDCKPDAAAAAAAASAAAANLDVLTLPGQPRGAGDARLLRAGFRQVQSAVNTDDTMYNTWTDGTRCLGVLIVGDRYQRVDEYSAKGGGC